MKNFLFFLLIFFTYNLFGIPVPGFTNINAVNYDENANQYLEGSCSYEIEEVEGCMIAFATNYNPLATIDDGSCSFNRAVSREVSLICTDSTAIAGSYFPYGDVESNLYVGDLAFTANEWLVDNSTCLYPQVIQGCTDASAANYNAAANTDDGTCVSSCTDIAVTVFGGGGTLDNYTEFSFYAEEMTYFDDSTYVVDAVDTSYVVSLDSSLVDSAWVYSNDTAMVVSYDTTLVVTLDSILVQNVLLSASRQDVYYNNPNDDIYISDTICIPEGSYVFDPSSYSSYSSNWYGDTFSVDAVCEDGSAILENNGGETPNPNGDNFTVNVVPCSAMTIGCSDSTALNFDAAATHDDGSCIPFIYGCTDSLAANYNADANTDDGLCADECLDVFVTIDGGYSVSSSNSWTVTNAANSVVANGGSVYSSVDVLDTLCLAYGSYSFNSYSSSYYGDWSDDTYSVFIQGCGSFDSAMVVSYDTALVVTIDSALVDSAWVFTSDSSEVVSADTSLVVTDNTFNVILANNADESPVDGSMESFAVISCDDVVFGCTDSIAENYNADATVNDGSCEFVFGCQIDYASNYDSTATVSNDTCYFDASLIAPAVGVTVDLSDADSISLSWEVALDLLGDTVEDYYVFLSSNPNDLGSSDFTSDDDQYTGSVQYYLGSVDTTSLVVQFADLYDWFISNGNGVNDVATLHWWVSDVRNYSSSGSPNYNSQYTLNDQAYNSHAINLTFTGVLGCTDSTAINFDPDIEATIDDGSCILPCSAEQSGLYVTTTAGSYASENSWELLDSDGELISSGAGAGVNEFPICVGSDSLTFNTYDAYDDSWDGATYEISLVCDSNQYVIANNGGEVPNNGVDEGVDGNESSEVFAAGSCDSFVPGCTDSGYEEFNPLANTDDGSCSVLACTGTIVAVDYTSSWWGSENAWSIDSAGVEILSGEGEGSYSVSFTSDEVCMLEDICYNVNMTDSYGDGWVSNTLSIGSVVYSGSGSSSTETFSLNDACAVLGCTNPTADNYNADADEDDGSCIFYGCNNPIADNYDSNATDDDGSCVFPCEEGLSQVDLLVTTDAYSSQIDYSISSTDGQSYDVDLTNNNNTTVVERYCFENGSDVSFQLNESAYGIILGGYQIYVCEELEFVNFDVNEAGSYTEEFMVACGEITGCTNSLACNFNSLATQDDGSCSIPGCTDNNYIEYFNQGFEAGCEDGSCSIEVKDFDLSPQNFQVQNITGNSMNIGFNSLSISNIESATIGAFYDLNGDGIINTDTFTNDTGETYSECVGLTDFNVDEFFTLALWGDNSSTNEVDGLIEGQSEVIFAILTQNNQVIVFDLLPEFPSYSSNGIIVSNGIELDVRLYGCTDPSYCSYDPNAEEDDGSCNGTPGCLDLFYTEYDIDANCNKQELCIVSWQDAYNSSQDDNVTLQNQLSDLSLELNVLNNQFTDSVEVLADLRNELEAVNTELTYWYNPIEINLEVGWNIIGYSIPEPQDVVATVQEINDIIVIIKNNAAEVYWPEFGFNGIGDFLPGQGYQINVSENYNGFSYPETQGQRFDLVPTVPDWVIDMEVELHPNDIRTLVRVVNMLGQEVNPKTEPKGTVLLYLYNDATVEKKLTK